MLDKATDKNIYCACLLFLLFYYQLHMLKMWHFKNMCLRNPKNYMKHVTIRCNANVAPYFGCHNGSYLLVWTLLDEEEETLLSSLGWAILNKFGKQGTKLQFVFDAAPKLLRESFDRSHSSQRRREFIIPSKYSTF